MAKTRVIHDETTKEMAVEEVNNYMKEGLTKNKAKNILAKKLNVHTTTITNWCKTHSPNRITRNIIVKTKKTTPITALRSITITTSTGDWKLPLKDIKTVKKLLNSIKL